MQFLLLAFDATDEGAPERRMKAREAHVALISEYREKGNMLMGAALLDDAGKMIGSAITVDFPSKDDLADWLGKEPYVLGKVWDKITITPCAVGPSFVKKGA